jgi:hypothetical protein
MSEQERQKLLPTNLCFQIFFTDDDGGFHAQSLALKPPECCPLCRTYEITRKNTYSVTFACRLECEWTIEDGAHVLTWSEWCSGPWTKSPTDLRKRQADWLRRLANLVENNHFGKWHLPPVDAKPKTQKKKLPKKVKR